jgi:hypothetical protein
MIREIFVQNPTDSSEVAAALRVRNPDGTVPHVNCEGARFHVLSWGTTGRRCTHPDCVVNREAEDTDEQ